MQYENLIEDLKELIKISKFIPSTKETKKYRKKIKKLISKIEDGEIYDVLDDIEY